MVTKLEFLPAKDCISRMTPVEDDIRKLQIDMYFGDEAGNKPVITRLAILERDMTEIKESRKENRIWFLGIIGSIIATLILMHLKVF